MRQYFAIFTSILICRLTEADLRIKNLTYNSSSISVHTAGSWDVRARVTLKLVQLEALGKSPEKRFVFTGQPRTYTVHGLQPLTWYGLKLISQSKKRAFMDLRAFKTLGENAPNSGPLLEEHYEDFPFKIPKQAPAPRPRQLQELVRWRVRVIDTGLVVNVKSLVVDRFNLCVHSLVVCADYDRLKIAYLNIGEPYNDLYYDIPAPPEGRNFSLQESRLAHALEQCSSITISVLLAPTSALYSSHEQNSTKRNNGDDYYQVESHKMSMMDALVAGLTDAGIRSTNPGISTLLTMLTLLHVLSRVY